MTVAEFKQLAFQNLGKEGADDYWFNLVVDFFDNFLKEDKKLSSEDEIEKNSLKEAITDYVEFKCFPPDRKDIVVKVFNKCLEL